MKHYGLLLAFSVILALAGTGGALAVFPEPDGNVYFHVNQGWYNGSEAWFISTYTTDINLANKEGLAVFQGIPTGAAPVYIVTNPLEPQGPVFSAAPDPVQGPTAPPYYSGIWRVIYVIWNSVQTRVPLVAEQQILDLVSTRALSLMPALTVVDYSIVAIGPLGNPDYLIPQAQNVNLARKEVLLPTWDIYGRDWATGRTFVSRIIIPDALSLANSMPGSIDIASLVGANAAYGLSSVGPIDNINAIAAINWSQFTPDGGFFPVPLDQLLVSRESPTEPGTANGNGAYSPFATFVVMARFPSVPQWVVFSDWAQLTNSPGLTGVYGGVVNAPIF